MDEESLLGLLLIITAAFFFWCSLLTVAIVLVFTTDWDSRIGEDKSGKRSYSGNNKRFR
jgi:hypothetical protein